LIKEKNKKAFIYCLKVYLFIWIPGLVLVLYLMFNIERTNLNLIILCFIWGVFVFVKTYLLIRYFKKEKRNEEVLE